MNAKIRLMRGVMIINLLIVAMVWTPSVDAAPKWQFSQSKDKSDLNSDKLVDVDDLALFARNYMQKNSLTVDWCAFYEHTIAGLDFDGKHTKYYLKHFRTLLGFIKKEFKCKSGPFMLELKHSPKYVFRITQSPDANGDFYVSDPKVGSVFFFDASMRPKAELKGLEKPLGIAVDSSGRLLVGNDGRDNVEVYDRDDGNLLAVFGEGLLRMPTAISIGPDGNIYVTDSQNHNVQVFDSRYRHVNTIGRAGNGPGELNFPVDTEVIGRLVDGEMIYEVFVADQGNKNVHIFDLEGNILGTVPKGRCSWFSGCKPPSMARLMALDSDAQGRLHILDIFDANVAIVNPETGLFIATYGEYGDEAGFLRTPFDLMTTATNTSLVVAGDGTRIEVITTP